ncbi:Cytochrome P450 [Geosmithia morbida]|uniref:Cytochrome P450 n=1 Tax=Geosmithia morbida TaxID=1094350 RepID=A0A9P5D2V3_9HYPO|nr:Cytochrome P450 [Geosmithia morbida]KAF4125493.1 Cytochrome P450 [Geosmithia morbida]
MLADALKAVWERYSNHLSHPDFAAIRHSSGLILLGSVGLAILAIVLRLFAASSTSDPGSLPLALEKQGARTFGFLSRMSFYLNCSDLYADAWHRFNKHGLPVLVPTLGARKEIFLPHSSLKWAISQPSRVLGMWDAFSEMFQLGHSLGDEKYMLDIWPHMLSRQVLTRELDDHLMDVHDELHYAMETRLGGDTQSWSERELLDTIRLIITQVGSRFTVGKTLCRNDEYLRLIMDTVDNVVTTAGALGFIPETIRPLFAKLICLPTFLKLRRLENRYYKAEFKTRLAALAAGDPDQPVDLLQKMLRFASKHRKEELATSQMTRRICMSSLAFVYLASFTTTNIVNKMMTSDAEHDTLSILRDEAERFLSENPDPRKLWTRSKTKDMIYADSVMRESLRLYTVPTRAVVRKVMVDGVVSDTGLPLPKGALISFVSQPMHTDPDRWDDPMRYDPFRFVRLRQMTDKSMFSDENHVRDAVSDDVSDNFNPNSFLSTSGLLVFGRGKNSCPGRLLMEIQLKMLISNLVRNYDIRLADHDSKTPRPAANSWVLEFIFPSSRTRFQFKRRTARVASVPAVKA